jgi:dolichol-phosphate mannosyltransferase
MRTSERLGGRALVIVPTYNESGTIAEVARRLFAAVDEDVDLLVVDDGSPDGTAGLVRELAATNERIGLLERTSKQGLGAAYLAGFERAIESGYVAVVEMDADLSHDPGTVPSLLEGLGNAELVIGSRYVPGGRIENWGAVRRWLSRLGNLYAGAWLGFGVKDSTSGFRAFRTGALQVQELATVASQGYAFQIEMALRVHQDGGRIIEVPIVFTERASGVSKMSKRIVIEALAHVTVWGVRDRWNQLRGRR